MPVMIMTKDYPELLLRGKAIQRDLVVRSLFGGQTALARLLDVTPSFINHFIWLRRRSRRADRFVTERLRRARPDLVGAWSVPWAKENGKKKAA